MTMEETNVETHTHLPYPRYVFIQDWGSPGSWAHLLKSGPTVTLFKTTADETYAGTMQYTPHPLFFNRSLASNTASNVLQPRDSFQYHLGEEQQAGNDLRKHPLGLQASSFKIDSCDSPDSLIFLCASDNLAFQKTGFLDAGIFLSMTRDYAEIPPTLAMTEMVIEIIVELLFVLALATKHNKDDKSTRRKFLEKRTPVLLKIHSRLEESKTTVAQTLTLSAAARRGQ
ncbi:hypothetical protein BJV77DRAFT_1119562 [Russula vinacea]|nr:hypothetical protein BJV77DRAFT_1119562 [Russula vinacea]